MSDRDQPAEEPAVNSIRAAIRANTQQGRPLLSAPVTVAAVRPISAGFARVTVAAEALRDYHDPWPADAFKLMLPAAGTGVVEFPQRDADGLPFWLDGSTPPVLRTYSVRRFDRSAGQLDFDVATHRGGLAMRWLAQVRPGAVVGLAGMRREFWAPDGLAGHVVIGDGSALPAMSAIAESLGPDVPVWLYALGVAAADRELLPVRAGVTVHWGPARADFALNELAALARPTGRIQCWLAGEGGLVRPLRRFLLHDWGIARDDVWATTYWHAGLDNAQLDGRVLDRYRVAAAAGLDPLDPDVVDRLEFEETAR